MCKYIKFNNFVCLMQLIYITILKIFYSKETKVLLYYMNKLRWFNKIFYKCTKI